MIRGNRISFLISASDLCIGILVSSGGRDFFNNSGQLRITWMGSAEAAVGAETGSTTRNRWPSGRHGIVASSSGGGGRLDQAVSFLE